MDVREHFERLLAADLPESGISLRMKCDGAGVEGIRIEGVVAQVGRNATAGAIAVAEKKGPAFASAVAPTS